MAEKEIQYIIALNDLRKKQKMASVNMNVDPSWVEVAERSFIAAKFDYAVLASRRKLLNPVTAPDPPRSRQWRCWRSNPAILCRKEQQNR